MGAKVEDAAVVKRGRGHLRRRRVQRRGVAIESRPNPREALPNNID